MEGHVLLLLPFLALTSPVVGSTTSNSWTSINRWRYGGFGSPFSSRARTIFRSVDRSEPWSPLWTDTGTVPNLISQVPPGKLLIDYPRGISIRPNDTLTTGLLWQRPRLWWRTRPGSLYTVIIVDTGIAALQGAQYFHWAVVNIPELDLGAGAEVMEYIPPFQASESDPPHTMLALVYEQNGPVVVLETQQGCTKDIGSSRIGDKDAFAEKYGLRLVAGNFLLTRGGGSAVDDLLCKFTRCQGEPFPAPIPGVNDGTACQQSQQLVDTTIRGPAVGKREDFYRALSPFFPDTISSYLRHYEGSTNNRVFQVITGLFDSPAELTTNEDEFGAGEMTVFLGNYRNDVYPAIFGTPEFQAATQLAFPTFEGGLPYKIVISTADDQDFDLATVLRDYNEVMEIDIVIPNKGQEEQFEKTRNEFIARARNIPGTRVYTFTAVDTPLGQWPGTPENLKYLATVYRSEDARLDAIEAGIYPQDFIVDYFSTFSCVACTLLGNDLKELQSAANYPDVPRRKRSAHWTEILV